MSTLYKCDRCGAVMERLPSDPHYRIGYQWQMHGSVNLKDLCENCSKELENWYHNVSSKENRDK